MLKTRILTALVLLACFIPALFYLPVKLWAGLMLLLSVFALREWANMAGLSKRAQLLYTSISLLLGLATYYIMTKEGLHSIFNLSVQLFLLVALFWCFVVPLWLAKGWVVRNKLVLMVLGLFLITNLWLALVTAKWLNPWLLLIILSIVWIADTAAYFAGKNFGKNKLAPSISPGKTWEGVAGAIVANSLFALVLRFTGVIDTWLIVPAFWLITVVGVYGDLFESMFKRQANMKDSGQLLPGHGGLLDRIDGVIPALPIAVLMLYFYHYTKSIL
jgi:phosphatidate cytidylyltransferase